MDIPEAVKFDTNLKGSTATTSISKGDTLLIAEHVEQAIPKPESGHLGYWW
jgi:hypothetical protein